MGINKFLPISIRNYFSDRNKIDKIPEEIQLESLNLRTRTGIFNLWSEIYYEVMYKLELTMEKRDDIVRGIAQKLYNLPAPAWKSMNEEVVLKSIEETIVLDSYNKIFDMLEFTIALFHRSNYSSSYKNNNYYIQINRLFEREFVGYRFIGTKISPISDSIEVESLQESYNSPYEVVKGHIVKANIFLSNREKPDYPNSVKESVSALEALAQIITGITGSEATLGKMLKKLEEEKIISSAMKSAFSTLYGFASESKGVRHSSVNGETVSFEEAKYIMVISTAFINFVHSKMKD
jgi:hypothetical protein